MTNTLIQLSALIEAFLFAKGSPVSLTDMAKAVGEDSQMIEKALTLLSEKYEKPDSGLTLHHTGAGYMLATKKKYDTWLSSLLGKQTPLSAAALAALVGMLGSFITGSNMSSNILFGSFQMTTAELVGLQPAPILAAQTVGGSAGSLISPSKIVLGATTAGHPEMVGAIIRKLLPVALLFSLTSGAVVLLSGLMLG